MLSNRLSHDINRLETEIDFYKEQAGISIWEIGHRLNFIKDNLLVRGEFQPWLKDRKIDYTAAVRMMKVARELTKAEAQPNLGMTALYLIASLPEALRHESYPTEDGKEKQPIDMSVKELRSLNTSLKEYPYTDPSIEYILPNHSQTNHTDLKTNILSEDDNLSLSLKNEELQKQLLASQESYTKLKDQYKGILSKEKEISIDLTNVQQLKEDISRLANQKQTVTSEIENLRNILKLKDSISILLSSISPLIFTTDIDAILGNRVIKDKFVELIDQVQQWCDDMYRKFKQHNVINAHVINVDND